MADIALVKGLIKKGFTKKQAQAMRCVIAAQGSFTAAAKIADKYQVSVGYIRDLMYLEKHQPWRDELERHLKRDVPAVDDLSEDYVIEGWMELTGAHVQDSVRLGAYNALANHLGMGAPKEIILTVRDLEKVKEMGLLPQVEKELQNICAELGVEWPEQKKG